MEKTRILNKILGYSRQQQIQNMKVFTYFSEKDKKNIG